MSKSSVILLTFFAWLIGCSLYAYFWVTSILASPNLYGYEKWKLFSLFGFLIYRFPFLLISLLIIVYAEALVFEMFPKGIKNSSE